MAVRDMARTAARYEAMGFLLTPYSMHSGAWKPGDPLTRLAYGNRCVMFRDRHMIQRGFDPVLSAPDEFAKFIQTDLQSKGALIKISGAKAD